MGNTILMAEDNERIRDPNKMNLQNGGHEVVEEKDEIEGMDLFFLYTSIRYFSSVCSPSAK